MRMALLAAFRATLARRAHKIRRRARIPRASEAKASIRGARGQIGARARTVNRPSTRPNNSSRTSALSGNGFAKCLGGRHRVEFSIATPCSLKATIESRDTPRHPAVPPCGRACPQRPHLGPALTLTAEHSGHCQI